LFVSHKIEPNNICVQQLVIKKEINMTKEQLKSDGLILDQWFSDICAKAASTLRNKFTDGLLSIVVTQEEYNNLKGKVTVKPTISTSEPFDTETTDEDGVIIKKNLANAIELQTVRKDIGENSTGMDTILEFVLATTDTELLESIFPNKEDMYKNNIIETIKKIKEEVSQPYMMAQRKNYLQKQLTKIMTNSENHQQYINRLNKYRTILKNNYKVTYNEAETIDIMEEGTKGMPSIQKVIIKYKIKISTENEEADFTKICKLIKTTLGINNVTTEEENFKETTAFKANVTTDKVNDDSTTQAAISQYKSSLGCRYCFKHGYQKSHQGSECRSKLTPLQKLAGSPRDVEDGCTTGDPFKKPPK